MIDATKLSASVASSAATRATTMILAAETCRVMASTEVPSVSARRNLNWVPLKLSTVPASVRVKSTTLASMRPGVTGERAGDGGGIGGDDGGQHGGRVGLGWSDVGLTGGGLAGEMGGGGSGGMQGGAWGGRLGGTTDGGEDGSRDGMGTNGGADCGGLGDG